jgi:tRNA-2-methylthio-N6-dimethylallyladenosine synthase
MYKNRFFYIKTFGCQMNERDSEIMSQMLLGAGYLETVDLADADLIILNTCSVRAKAEQKVMSMLGYLRKNKKLKPSLKICVAGCVAQQEGEKIVSRMPHVDLVVGTQNIYDIGRLLEEAEKRGPVVSTDLQDDYVIPQFLPEFGKNAATSLPSPAVLPFRKFVTIMQGCNNFCTYCVVPYTRGREVSRNSGEILDEVKVLIDGGVKEITLLGQNVNSYGTTNRVSSRKTSYGFADLLHEVSEISGLKRLRFTTSHPKDLTDELISCFQKIAILSPQLHLPVQAGSDRILKRMNRKYTIAQYLEKVRKLREARPDIALTTDIIVGFPGENDTDFRGTMQLLEEVRYHGSFSFKYSDRPGTKASQLRDKISESLKTERLAQFQQRQDEISLERNLEYVGLVKEIMIESVGVDGIVGRTDTNHIVHVKEQLAGRPGDFIKVEIVHAGQHSLQGKSGTDR